ncbi:MULTISPECIES: ABC transporter ATP-binding protein [unclassified Lacrimispora]|uniref:ABC transporter ATP-binding protein n=1 Tax=unclassified Lacrimispora TaxID=2719232 RepID=UPI003057ABAB|nr:ABC transporter ATP-binding protein [Lachnospiraceae bacterium]
MLLEIDNLCLSFGGLKATNDVTMHMEAGKINGIIGPNGAGKTTFFNLISGVYKPDSGSITFDGKRIDGMKPFEINQAGIARTYQVINLFKNMSVVDNVIVGMHPRLNANFFESLIHSRKEQEEEVKAREKAFEWLEFVGLKEHAMEAAGSLSYGKQRLLEIVRGLASDPKLILLDEPAAGMNSREKEELNSYLRKILTKGVTILIVEHDMKLMMDITDRLFVLNYGQKLAEGSPGEIQKNPEVIAAYLGGDD